MTVSLNKSLKQRYNPLYLSVIVIVLLTLQSCSVNKFLGPNEALVKKNEIEIQGKLSKKELKTLETDLKNKIKLKPNSKTFFFFPSERRQLRISKIPPSERDSSWFGSFITNNFSEAPALVDSTTIEYISKNLEAYLKSKGYFHATVTHEIIPVSSKRSTIKYSARLEKLYKTKGIRIISKDSTLYDEIRASTEGRDVEGEPVSQSLYDKEVDRITNSLRNNGYYEFYPSYISRFKTFDTSSTELGLELDIGLPEHGPLHRRYVVGDIFVYPDFNPLDEGSVQNSIRYEDLMVQLNGEKSPVRPAVLNRRIEIRKGDLFNQDNFSKTIKQLGKLSIYRPPRISILKNEEVDSLLDYHIYLTRNKKYSSNFNLDLFYSTISASNQVGISVEGVFTNRNIFGGSEQLTVRISPGVEISRNLANTRYITASTEITTPRLYDWFGLFKLARIFPNRKKPLLKADNLYFIERNANTSFRFSYGYYEYETFYRYNSLNLDYLVRFRKDDQKDFTIGISSINFWNPDKLERFDDIAQGNELFIRSFDKQFLTGIIFRSFAFRYNSPYSIKGWSDGWVVFSELSGLEMWAATNIVEGLGGDPIENINIGEDTIAISKFFKFEIDRTYTKRLPNDASAAFRISTGIVQPFGRTETAPYNSKFYLGGPYSMRAWRVRELGPGGNNDTTAAENKIPFYQVGDLKLELNAEYRFKLFWLLEGALFVDVGNIWNTQTSDENKEDDITLFRLKDFYKQIAIGAGFGIRLDFNYFIFRLDAGHKIKNNYLNDQGSYWAIDGLGDLSFSKLNWNLGIGYPF